MARIGPDQPVSAGTVVAIRLKELRQRRGYTAKQFADRCAELGAAAITVHVIANIETGRREASVNELLVFALVLDVAPVHLLTPSERRPLTVAITDTVAVSDQELIPRWVRGEQALSASDGRKFYGFSVEQAGAPDTSHAMSEYARAMVQDSVKRIAAQYDAEAAEFMARTRSQIAGVLDDLAHAVGAGASGDRIADALDRTRRNLLDPGAPHSDDGAEVGP